METLQIKTKTEADHELQYRKSKEFVDWAYGRHDFFCNQKYDTTLPYSTHLKFAHAQFKRYKHLIPEDKHNAVRMAVAGHDLIEDARVTFNDLKADVGEEVAEMIYACTEMRGHNRDERHSVEYYEYLAKNELAIFVKLCDILANVKYGLLTNSSMLKKHKREHEHTLRYLYVEKYAPMYQELSSIFNL